MRIIHFTLGSVDPNSLNGINRVIEGLASTMNAAQLAEVSVITVRSKMTRPGREVFSRDGFTVTACHSTDEALKLFAEHRGEIDLVHLHNAWSIPNVRLGAWLADQKIPYVLTPHAAFLPDRMQSRPRAKALFHKLVQHRLLDQASALIAVSRDEMESIAKFSKNDRIFCVPNGSIDVDWRAYRRINPPRGKVVIGYLGRIKREKNILALVRAIDLMPPDVRAMVELRLFGETGNAYAQECMELSLSLGLADIVQFRGSVNAGEKWTALSELDVYIQPSLSEAASISVVEAISMGLPVIATRTSGVSYWHGQPFLTMVEPIALELARGMEILVRRQERHREYGQAARRFFEDRFTWAIIAQKQAEVYRACVAPGSFPPRAE